MSNSVLSVMTILITKYSSKLLMFTYGSPGAHILPIHNVYACVFHCSGVTD